MPRRSLPVLDVTPEKVIGLDRAISERIDHECDHFRDGARAGAGVGIVRLNVLVMGSGRHHLKSMVDAAPTPVARLLCLSLVALAAYLGCGRPPATPNAAVVALREAEDAQLNSERFGTTPFSPRDQLRHSMCWQASLEGPVEGEFTFGCGADAVARD